ncbi:uncharacterized protein LOC100897587 [Galendromus occidentalis]|uniref:Uncharacterized protein LOC100897587 n=1 Tax=Galendromus occidentalis TaxID=34638 RepID=A0AAJ6QQR4_9ACAR|nr:uncharacterized protein LOC100897587 [Galendromus occidentalis]
MIMSVGAFLDEDDPPDLFDLPRFPGPGNDGGYRVQLKCICLSDICYYPSSAGWEDIYATRNQTSRVYEVGCDCELGGICDISYFFIPFDVSQLYHPVMDTESQEEPIDTEGWREELRNISNARSFRVHQELYKPVFSDNEVSPAKVTICVMLRTSENVDEDDPDCTYL